MALSSITSDSYKCAVSSHPFRIPPSLQLYTHPPTHPGLHSFSKVNFKLLLMQDTVHSYICVASKFCFLWEAYRNWSIFKWSRLNLDSSNKYWTHHRPTSFLVMFLHLCPVPAPSPRLKGLQFREQVLLSPIIPMLPTAPFMYVHITSQKIQWSFHNSKHLSTAPKINTGPRSKNIE